jgi:hypothetical protein
MYYLKKLNMICFDAEEMKALFESTMKTILQKELDSAPVLNEFIHGGVKQIKTVMNKITDSVVVRETKDKSYIEFFIAIDTCFSLYKGEDRKICFVLKDSLPPKNIPKNLEELKSIIKEDTLTDFAIWSDVFGQFQLKQYRGELKTESLFNFIKIKSCGTDWSSTILLIILQGNGRNFLEIDFEEVHKKLLELKFSLPTEILVVYNEQNNFNVINQIYPDLKSMRKKISLPSENWGR